MNIPLVNPSEARAPVVVVISDDATEAKRLTAAFENAGIPVHLATDGSTGIAQVYQRHPDLLVAPVLLPELDGYQICRLLRHDISTRHISIVLLAEAEAGSTPWCNEVAADSVINRTAAPDEILATCLELLGERMQRPRPLVRTEEEQQLRERRSQWNRRVSYLLEERLYRTTLISRVNPGLCRYEDPIANRRAILGQLSQAIEFDAALLFVEGDRKCLVSLRAPLSEAALQPLVTLLHDNMAALGVATLRLPRDLHVILGDGLLGEVPAHLGSLACAAMHSGERLMGYVALGAIGANAFSSDDLSLLEMFGVQAAAVLENSLLVERNAVLAAAVQNLDDAVLLTDLQEIVVHANPAATRLFDRPASELMGHRVRQVFSPRFPPEQLSKLLASVESSWQGEAIGLRGSEHFPLGLEVAAIRTRSGAIIGTVIIGRDLTPVKQQQAERLRAAELTTLLEVAVALNHEINNPLQAIMSCAQLLQYQLRDLTQPEVHDKLRMITEQTQRIADSIRKLEHAKAASRRQYVTGQTMIDLEASAKAS